MKSFLVLCAALLVALAAAAAHARVDTDAADEWQARAIATAFPSTRRRLLTSVGAISVADVAGKIDVETSVGALTLSGLSGEVDARTNVGAISIALDGDRWVGEGLTATTRTGGIKVTAAADYSARFDLRTALGSGFLSRGLIFRAGEGGARIQA